MKIHVTHVGFMVMWLLAFFAIERINRAFPPQSRSVRDRLRRWTSNLMLGAINNTLLSSLLALPFLAWASSIQLWRWPNVVPSWVLIVLTVVILDFAGYWFHRLSHYYECLWRLHQIHHLDEIMDVTTGLRVHFAEKVLYVGITAVLIIACNLPFSGVILHAIAGFALATFHHSNVKIPNWLERLLAPSVITPAFHHPHHHELKRDTNSNYGFMFPWWDFLFGTLNTRRRKIDWRMGLDYSSDLSCLGLLCEPFQVKPLWKRRKHDATASSASDERKK